MSHQPSPPPSSHIVFLPPLYYDLSYTSHSEQGRGGDIIVISIDPKTGKVVKKKIPGSWTFQKDVNTLLSTVNLLTTQIETIGDMRVPLEKLAFSTAMTIINTAKEKPDTNPS